MTQTATTQSPDRSAAAIEALEKINAYNGGDGAPTLRDYQAAGVTGVTEANLRQVNSLVANFFGSERDVADIERYAAVANQNLAPALQDTPADRAFVKINAFRADRFMENPMFVPEPTVQDYADTGIPGVTEHYLSGVNNRVIRLRSTVVDADNLQRLIDQVIDFLDKINAFLMDETRPQPTANDYVLAGTTTSTAFVTDGFLGTFHARLRARLRDQNLPLTSIEIGDVNRDIRGAINDVNDYRERKTDTPPTVNHYERFAVTNVTEAILERLNDRVRMANSRVFRSNLQPIVDELNSLDKIEAFRSGRSSDEPEIQDYQNLGINGVTQAIREALNERVEVERAQLNLMEIQSLFREVAALLKINAYRADQNLEQPAGEPAPAVQDYIDVGVTGVTSSNLDELNNQVSMEDSDVDLPRLETLRVKADALIKIDAYRENQAMPAPEEQDYMDAGVTAVTEVNLPFLNERVSMEGTRVTTARLQTIVGEITPALNKIEEFRSDVSENAPTAQDYQNIGIDGVTAAILPDFNTRVDAETAQLSLMRFQALFRVSAALAKINAYHEDQGMPAPETQDYIDLGITDVNDLYQPSMNARIRLEDEDSDLDVPRLETIFAEVSTALDKINAYREDQEMPAPEIQDFINVGVIGVTDFYLPGLLVRISRREAGNENDVDWERLQNVLFAFSREALDIIEAFRADETETQPRLNNYSSAGVNGVTENTLPSLNIRVDAANEPLNAMQLQALHRVIRIAYDKINAYSMNQTMPPPELADYESIAVMDVTASMVPYLNFLVARDPRAVTLLTEREVKELNEDIRREASLDVSLSAIQSQIREIISSLDIIEAFRSGSSEDALTIEEYEDAGVFGVTHEILPRLNDLVADEDSRVDAARIQELIEEVTATALAKINDYNGDYAKPTLADYSIIGVDVGLYVAEANALVVASDNPALTPEEIQELVADTVTALTNINAYDGSNTPPSLNDYYNAGVTDVTVSNRDRVNLYLANRPILDFGGGERFDAVEGTLGTATINRIVRHIDRLFMLSDEDFAQRVEDGAMQSLLARINAYDATSNTATPTIEDYRAVGVTELNGLNFTEFNRLVAVSSDDNLTLTELQALVTTANNNIPAIRDGLARIHAWADSNGTGSDGIFRPSLNHYTDAGVTGVTGFNNSQQRMLAEAINDSPIAVLKVSDVQDLVDAIFPVSEQALERIQTYFAPDNSNTPPPDSPTLEDYRIAGVTGVFEANFALLNATVYLGVVDTSGNRNPLTLTQIQEQVSVANNNLPEIREALRIINDYDGQNTPPSVANYHAIGVTGVTEAIRDDLNAFVRGSQDDSLQFPDIQPEATRLAAEERINSYDGERDSIPPTLADYGLFGVTGVTEANLAELNRLLGDANHDEPTVTQIEALVATANTNLTAIQTALLAINSYDGNSGAPTVLNYETIRVTGVTGEILNALNALVADSEDDSLQAPDIQRLVTILTQPDMATALTKINANISSGDPLTVDDYAAAGVAGVYAGRVGLINRLVEASNGRNVDITSERLNHLVDIVARVETALGGTLPARDAIRVTAPDTDIYAIEISSAASGPADLVVNVMVNGAGAATSIDYDLENNLTVERRETFTFNAAGLRTQSAIDYDNDGTVDSVERHIYNNDGRLVISTFDDTNDGTRDRLEAYGEDSDGNLIWVQTINYTPVRGAVPRGEIVFYQYNDAGQRTRATYDYGPVYDGENRFERYLLNAAGQRLEAAYEDDDLADDNVVPDAAADRYEIYRFDSAGYITRTSYDDDGDELTDRIEIYELNNGGQRIKTSFDTDADGTANSIESYEVNGFGYRTQTTFDTDANNTSDRIETYQLNSRGQRLRADIDDGADNSVDRVETYELNEFGDRTKTTTTNANGVVTGVEYDADGDGSPNRIEDYMVNASGHRIRAEIDTDGDGNPDQIEDYTVNASGHRTRAEINDGNNNRIRNEDYTVNDAGHRTRAEINDANNNRIRNEDYTNNSEGHRTSTRFDDDNDDSPDRVEVYHRTPTGEIRATAFDTTADGTIDRIELGELDNNTGAGKFIQQSDYSEFGLTVRGLSDIRMNPQTASTLIISGRDIAAMTGGVRTEEVIITGGTDDTVSLAESFSGTNRTRVIGAETYDVYLAYFAHRVTGAVLIDSDINVVFPTRTNELNAQNHITRTEIDLDADGTVDRIEHYGLTDITRTSPAIVGGPGLSGRGNIAESTTIPAGTVSRGHRISASIDADADGTVDWIETYGLNGVGQRISVTYDDNADGTDDRAEFHTNADITPLRTETYESNTSGHRIKTTFDDNVNGTADRIETYVVSSTGQRLRTGIDNNADGVLERAELDGLSGLDANSDGTIDETEIAGATPDGTVDQIEIYEYNAAGHLIKTNFIDDADALTITHGDVDFYTKAATEVDRIETYEVNAQGQRTKTTVDNNADGWADREIFFGNADGVPTRILTHEYQGLHQGLDQDRAAIPVKTSFDEDGDGNFERVESYTYNSAGVVVRTATDTGNNGRVDKVEYHGVTEGATGRIEEYSYNGAGQLTETRFDSDANGNANRIEKYGYNSAGQRIRVSHDDEADGKIDRIITSAFNPAGQTTRVIVDSNADGVPDRGRSDGDNDGTLDTALEIYSVISNVRRIYRVLINEEPFLKAEPEEDGGFLPTFDDTEIRQLNAEGQVIATLHEVEIVTISGFEVIVRENDDDENDDDENDDDENDDDEQVTRPKDIKVYNLSFYLRRVDDNVDGTIDRTETVTTTKANGITTITTRIDYDAAPNARSSDVIADEIEIQRYNNLGLIETRFDTDADGFADRIVSHFYIYPGQPIESKIAYDDGANDGTADDGTIDRTVLTREIRNGVVFTNSDNDNSFDRVQFGPNVAYTLTASGFANSANLQGLTDIRLHDSTDSELTISSTTFRAIANNNDQHELMIQGNAGDTVNLSSRFGARQFDFVIRDENDDDTADTKNVNGKTYAIYDASWSGQATGSVLVEEDVSVEIVQILDANFDGTAERIRIDTNLDGTLGSNDETRYIQHSLMAPVSADTEEEIARFTDTDNDGNFDILQLFAASRTNRQFTLATSYNLPEGIDIGVAGLDDIRLDAGAPRLVLTGETFRAIRTGANDDFQIIVRPESSFDGTRNLAFMNGNGIVFATTPGTVRLESEGRGEIFSVIDARDAGVTLGEILFPADDEVVQLFTNPPNTLVDIFEPPME